jgi:ABC-type amino acid transport substrate-binding protein
MAGRFLNLFIALYWCVSWPLNAGSVEEKFNGEISVALEDADNTPFEKVSADRSSITGFHVELITAVAESIGKKVRWVPLPWSRAIDSAYKGSVDAISYISQSKERSANLIFLPGNELHTDRICVFMRKGYRKNKFNGTIESLFGEKVGIAKDYFLTQEIEQKKHKFNLVEITTVGAQMYTMLEAGRIDYVFGSGYRLRHISSKDNMNNIESAGPCRPGEKRYIGFSKKKPGNEAFANQFEEALIKWKKRPEFKNLKTKFSFWVI